MDILNLNEVAKGSSEQGAVAPGVRVRDGRAECVAAVGVPRGRLAPARPHRTSPPNPHRDKLATRMRELAVANPRRGLCYIMELLRKERWLRRSEVNETAAAAGGSASAACTAVPPCTQGTTTTH